MALEKITTEDKIELVGPFKHIQVRTKTAIVEDGVEISASYHRHVVAPDSDVSGESAEVQALANLLHTDEVKAAYAEHLAAQAGGI